MSQLTKPSSQTLLALDFFAGLGRFQDSMFVISLAVAARDSGFDPGETGFATGTYLALSAITAAPKGRLFDRLGTQRPAQLLLIGVAVSYLFLLLALRDSSFALMLISCLSLGALRLNSGMMMQALWSAVSADSREFTSASARETLITTFSQTVGPLLAAGLIAFQSGALALAGCGVLATSSMLVWSFLAPSLNSHREIASVEDEEDPTRLPRRALRVLLVGSLLAFPLASLQLALASSESGASAAVLVATFTLGSALTVTASALNKEVKVVGWLGLTTLAPFLLSLPFLLMALGALSPSVLALSLVVAGGSFSLASVSNRVSIYSFIPRRSHNQAFGFLVTGAAAASGLGAILFGQLYEYFGLSGATLAFSTTLIAIALLIPLLQKVSWFEGGVKNASR